MLGSLPTLPCVLGVGLTVLSKFANTSTLQADEVAQEAVNDTIDAIAEIPSNWLGVVVKGVGPTPYPAELSWSPLLSSASCCGALAVQALAK